jgi:hypothetical protein
MVGSDKMRNMSLNVLSNAGWSGYSGFSGYSGVSGFSGISGFSGYSGGVSGYSGYSGMGGPGFSGYSGISGIATVIIQSEPAPTGVINGDLWWDTSASAIASYLQITNVSNTYSVQAADEVLICSSGPYNVYLPATTGSDRVLYVKNINSGNITVVANGTDVIDTTSTQIIQQWNTLQIIDGATGYWYIL